MKFTWKAKNNESGWTDGPVAPNGDPIVFDTQDECYSHMRSAALNKMKWNTEWEDFESTEEKDDLTVSAESIGYDVRFYPHKIVHVSYSGKYVYEIIPIR